MKQLFVKLDEVAALREIKKKRSPDPATAATFAELGGADGITVRFFENRCGIKDQDIRALRRVVNTRLNLEMTYSSEMVGIALDVRPEMVTLVAPGLTDDNLEAPLDLIVHYKDIIEVTATLKNHGIEVGVLVKPEMEQVKLAYQASVDRIQIFTQDYCDSTNESGELKNMDKIINTIKLSKKLKLKISAGRGLDYTSIKAFEDFPEIDTFCIGHSILSRALLIGLKDAVKEMSEIIRML